MGGAIFPLLTGPMQLGLADNTTDGTVTLYEHYVMSGCRRDRECDGTSKQPTSSGDRNSNKYTAQCTR